MTMGKRGWFLALLVWVFAGDLAPAHEWIKPYERDDFQQFLRDFSLQAQYGAKREYPLPWHKNLRDFRYLSTKDYLVVGKCDLNFPGKTSFSPFCHFFVVSLAPESFGRRLASFRCLYGADSAAAVAVYYHHPQTNMELSLWFRGYQPFKGVGEWALAHRRHRDYPAKLAGHGAIDFCRNGVVVLSGGEDFGSFHYLQFLRDLDALLQRQPPAPAPAPGGAIAAAYQRDLERYLAWLQERKGTLFPSLRTDRPTIFEDDFYILDRNIGANPLAKHKWYFQEFLEKNGLMERWLGARAYPPATIDNVANFPALSTKDYLVVSTKDARLSNAVKNDEQLLDDWDTLRVVSIAPGDYGETLALCKFRAFFDDRQVIAGYYSFWKSMNAGAERERYIQGRKRNDALRLGDWALCGPPFEGERNHQGNEVIDFCRNGVVVLAAGRDGDGFRYLPFLRDLDAILQREPPAPAPEGFSEAEYQGKVKKYQAWAKVEWERKREKERREDAKRHAWDARVGDPPRPAWSAVVWVGEAEKEAGKGFVREFFPAWADEFGTWEKWYRDAPDNPVQGRVTPGALGARFGEVKPLAPDYRRPDAAHVGLDAPGGKGRYEVAVLCARSAPEAREALAWLCLTGGTGDLRASGAAGLRKSAAGPGEFCLERPGDAPGAAREAFFLRGHVAAMVIAEGAGGDAMEAARWLDGLLTAPVARERFCW